MDELEFDSAGEAFVEGEEGFESTGMSFLCVEFGCYAEFLHVD